MVSSTLLLTEKQIDQRINRIAYQIYEDNSAESEIILAGIVQSGYQVAEMLQSVLKKLAPFSVRMVEVRMDKHSQVNREIELSIPLAELNGKSIVLVDDVLNSGKTLMYALKPFLAADIKKIRTVVLVNRNHTRYPVAGDFVGLTLATTLQEHVTVEFGNGKASAWLK